jgi:hypothetical protein
VHTAEFSLFVNTVICVIRKTVSSAGVGRPLQRPGEGRLRLLNRERNAFNEVRQRDRSVCATSWLQTRESSDVSSEKTAVASTPAVRCTAGCTGDAGWGSKAGGDPLAEFVAGLNPEERRRLVTLLAGIEEYASF